jgi:hypothetical protein
MIRTRKLTGKDVRFLARVLSKSIGTSLEKLRDSPPTVDKTQIGIHLFAAVLADNVDVIWEWLASVALMSPEELDEAPPVTPIHIIKSLEGDEGVMDFFASVSELLPAKPEKLPGL